MSLKYILVFYIEEFKTYTITGEDILNRYSGVQATLQGKSSL